MLDDVVIATPQDDTCMNLNENYMDSAVTTPGQQNSDDHAPEDVVNQIKHLVQLLCTDNND